MQRRSSNINNTELTASASGARQTSRALMKWTALAATAVLFSGCASLNEPVPLKIDLKEVHLVLQDTASATMTYSAMLPKYASKLHPLTIKNVETKMKRDIPPMVDAFMRGSEQLLKPELEKRGIEVTVERNDNKNIALIPLPEGKPVMVFNVYAMHYRCSQGGGICRRYVEVNAGLMNEHHQMVWRYKDEYNTIMGDDANTDMATDFFEDAVDDMVDKGFLRPLPKQ